MSLSNEDQKKQKLELQNALKVQKKIRQSEDELVIGIQSALDNSNYWKPEKNKKEKLEESQFRNVVRVAETTDSAEVVKNFLRYQLGRDKKWGDGKNSLAENIINDIDKNLNMIAKNIAQEIEPSKQKDIHIELIRRYLGYGSRYLKYLHSL